jgi:hypothetical protein
MLAAKAAGVSCPLEEFVLLKLEARKPATLFNSRACAIASSEVRKGCFKRI